MYCIVICAFLIVTVSWATDYSNHSYSLSFDEWALSEEFGIGIGETGKIYLTITNSSHDPDDHVLSVTLTGPSGFSFYIAEYPTSVSDWESERQSVGTTADVVSSVAGDLIEGQITDMIIEAAMNLSGYTIPYYNVFQALQTVNSAYEIWQTLESGIEYDIITYMFESSASGLYEFTIHNPTFHPYSNNALTIMILPIEEDEVTARFTQNGSIISDNITGLQWLVGPDEDTNWFAACDWVDRLGDDWRMPTVNELENLFNAGISTDSWGLFENSGSWVSANSTSMSRFGHIQGDIMNFITGFPDALNRDGDINAWQSRAFAVRSR